MIGRVWSPPPRWRETTLIRRLTDAETAGTVVLWHPESSGVKVRVRPGWLRRLRLAPRDFATHGEMRRPVSYVSGFPWLALSDEEQVLDPELPEEPA